MPRRVVYVSNGKLYSSKRIQTIQVMFTSCTYKAGYEQCSGCKSNACSDRALGELVLSKNNGELIVADRLIGIGYTLLDLFVVKAPVPSGMEFRYKYTPDELANNFTKYQINNT